MQGDSDLPASAQSEASHLLPTIDLDVCMGCGNCAALCPTQAVEIVDSKAAITKPSQCTYCDVCETFCPEGAIRRPLTIVFAPDQVNRPA
jgi:MinD superfamily P-loop ATPase